MAADSSPAPGTYAGGETFGALTSAGFMTPGSWDATFIHALGTAGTDAEINSMTRPYEALVN